MKHESQIALKAQAQSRRPRWIKPASLVAADVLAGLIAFAFAVTAVIGVRDNLGIHALTLNSSAFLAHALTVIALTVVALIWFRSKGHYTKHQALADQIGAILTAAFMAMMTSAAVQLATIEVGSRLLTGLYWALFAPLLLLTRLFVRSVLKASQLWCVPAVLFTNNASSEELKAFIRRRREIGLVVSQTFFVADSAPEEVLAAMTDAREQRFEIIYAPGLDSAQKNAVMTHLVVRGVPFILAPDLGPIPHRSSVMAFPPEDIALVRVDDPLSRSWARGMKRVIDIAASLAALVVLSPLLIAVAITVKADGGPALFRQSRIGKGGRPFKCLKFRSMAVDAEERLQRMIASDLKIRAEWEANYKLRNDPRITKIGIFLRKSNIDELPQLINILRGDMSIVGPRPVTGPEIELYGDARAAYERVQPGLTGLWQTNGRNNTTFEERVKLDAWYVRNWSLWRDIVITIRTVREVVLAKGV